MNDAITKNTEKKRRRLAIVFVGLSPITTCSVKSKQLHCSRPDSLNCLCQTQNLFRKKAFFEEVDGYVPTISITAL